MPVSRPVRGSGCAGTSAQENATYQPSASLKMVTVLGVPAIGRDQRTAIRGDALFQRGVVERTTVPQNRSQRPFLFGRRLEFVLVGFAQTLAHKHPSACLLAALRLDVALDDVLTDVPGGTDDVRACPQ